MLQILNAATIAATHHAATSSGSSGHLSPVYFLLAIVIFMVIMTIFSGIMSLIMRLTGDKDAMEMCKVFLISTTNIALVITIIAEVILCTAAALGGLPWV